MICKQNVILKQELWNSRMWHNSMYQIVTWKLFPNIVILNCTHLIMLGRTKLSCRSHQSGIVRLCQRSSLPMKHSTSQDLVGPNSAYLLENLEELVAFLRMSAGRVIKAKLLVLAATLCFSWL